MPFLLINPEIDPEGQSVTYKNEYLIRNVYSIVLSHFIYSVKGGWQQLEETINYLLLQSEHVGFTTLNVIPLIYTALFSLGWNICNVYLILFCR